VEKVVLSVDAEAEFLETVYEAAVQPELWADVLERLSNVLGAASANLTFQDQVTGAGRAITFGTDTTQFDSYFGYFATRNPLLKITDYPLALRVMTDEDKLPKEELVRGEYYNDFLKAIDAHSILIFRLAIENSNTTVLNVVRPANREPFRGRDIESARRLHPHLVRAFRVAAKLSNMEARLAGFEEILDRSASAAFVVDRGGRLLHANRKAEALLAACCGFALRRGVLQATGSDSSRRLAALIGAAAVEDKAQSRSGAMTIGRPAPKKPLSVTVTPARKGLGPTLPPASCVLISVTDPGAGIEIPEQRLRDLFGLTRMEAKVAIQLLDGCDVRRAADNLSLSYNTVRAHLGRMFAKTGSHRQTQLVQMMMRAL